MATPTLDHVLAAISDPTRRAILQRLARGPARMTDLAEPFDMSLAAVSKHIKILESAKLLVRKRHGRIHSCTLDESQLKNAEACIKFYTQF